MATKNVLTYDAELIPRVKQYLEANVHKTYVDIEEMTNSLMNRYQEYSRRKRVGFRLLVERAYKLVLRDYGLDSSNGSDVEGSDDLEVMDDDAAIAGANQMNNTLNSLYMKKPNPVTSTSDAAAISIDISSDEEDKENDLLSSPVSKTAPANKPPASSVPAELPPPSTSASSKVTKVVTNGTKVTFDSIPVKEELTNPRPGPASQKKRKLETTQIHQTSNSAGIPEFSASSSKSQQSQSKPKKYKKEVYATRSSVTFADVGGADKILKELCELILHIKHPEMYKHIGLPPPRGILLSGPPGSGKTLLANAIAGQLDVLLVEVPATELIAGVSGESEERIREIFEQAAVFAPCVLFIDEIDAISSNRQNAQKDMERRIVSQLLSSLDGMSKLKYGDEVLVIGATNRPDVLDPALRRVGRFDNEIALGIPDRTARSQILNIISRDLKIDEGFDYDEIAALTPGYVAADLLALTTRAALTAIKRVIRSKEVKAITADDKIEVEEEITAAPENENIEKPQEAMESDKAEIQKMDIDETHRIPEELSDLVPILETNENSGEGETSEAIKQIETESNKNEMEVEPSESHNDEQKLNDKPVEAEKMVSIIPPLTELKLEEMLKWLQTDSKLIEIEELREMSITRDDFVDAVKHTQPSSKREGFVTVPDVTWDDIGSLQDIRSELKLAILAPVKFPEKLERLGLQSPSGIMLCGPPGCGKTLLAKAIANEAGINFISVKGPELLNMYVGESERAVRQCFQRAKNSAPCVIFFDEFDSLCPKRSDSGENSSQRVVNQLLTEMDGIEDRKGVFLMAATNRPDIIDPAVLRPGRLDKILYVGLPNTKDRVEIFRALTKNGQKPELADDVNFEEIASLTDGYTGADLAGLVRQAALQTLKESIEGDESDDLKVHRNHFIEVIKKVKPSVSSEDIKHYNLLKIKYGARQEN